MNETARQLGRRAALCQPERPAIREPDHDSTRHGAARPRLAAGFSRLRAHICRAGVGGRQAQGCLDNDLLRTLEGADAHEDQALTCAAGYNIVASATRGRRKIIAVVLGEASGMDRSVRAAKLIEHGFQMFDWKSAFPGPLLETLPTISQLCGAGFQPLGADAQMRCARGNCTCAAAPRPCCESNRRRQGGQASGQQSGYACRGQAAARREGGQACRREGR